MLYSNGLTKCYMNIPMYFVHASSDNIMQFSFNSILVHLTP